ncbi:MAG: methyl-accepting chemotaxis protein [Marinobacter sp.]|nr:methyl-accepting chemotaxis protein [Marinobacter sp.]
MNFINYMSMRNKLLTLVMPALLVTVYFAAQSIVMNYNEMISFRALSSMAELAEIGDPVIEELQKERGRSAVILGSDLGTPSFNKAQSALKNQRQETDARISSYNTQLSALLAERNFDRKVKATIEAARQGLDSLDMLRQSVDGRNIAAAESGNRYASLIAGLIDSIPLIIRRSTDSALTREITAYYSLAQAAEMSGRERATGAHFIRNGVFELSILRRVADLGGQQDAFISEAVSMLNSDAELRTALESQKSTAANQALEQMRQTLFSGFSGVEALEASDWFATTTQRIGELNEIRSAILANSSSMAATGLTDARNGLVIASGIALAAILGVIFLMFFIIKTINSQVSRLLKGVRYVMENKDLTRLIEISSKDEIADIGTAINELFGRFGHALQKMDRSSVQLATSTEETSSTAGQNAAQVKNQQQQIEQVAAATEEMSSTSEEISRNTQQVADASKNAMEKSETGGQVLHESVDSIRSLAASIEKVNGVIAELESRSVTISDVVDVIRKVADQTNLLALNAAIEAARAGEHGRGFSVVADEVRALAQQTHQSTTQIEEIINGFRDITESASHSIIESHKLANTTSEQASDLEQTFTGILADINSISDMASQIATASEEQVAVTHELAGSMESVSEVAILTLTGSQEITEVTEEQARLARELQDLANEFKLNDNNASS